MARKILGDNCFTCDICSASDIRCASDICCASGIIFARKTGGANRTRRKANITEKDLFRLFGWICAFLALAVRVVFLVIFRLCRSDIVPYGTVIFPLTRK